MLPVADCGVAIFLRKGLLWLLYVALAWKILLVLDLEKQDDFDTLLQHRGARP